MSLLQLICHSELHEKYVQKGNNLDIDNDDNNLNNNNKSPVKDVQAMLNDDDDMVDCYNDTDKHTKAKAEDDYSESSSNDDDDVVIRAEENVLITDNEEKRTIKRYLKNRLNTKNNKRKQNVEKYQTDPEWFEFLNQAYKRRKTGENEDDEIEVRLKKNSEEMIFSQFEKQSMLVLQKENLISTQKALLNDYLSGINSYSVELKLEMYKKLIKLLHITRSDSRTNVPQLDKEVITFISQKDRDMFFEVVKFWIHYKFNQLYDDKIEQFHEFLKYILDIIISSNMLVKHSAKWVNFIMVLPRYNDDLFQHIDSIVLVDFKKEMPAIKVLQKLLLSSFYKLSIKKSALKILLKVVYSAQSDISRTTAINVIVHAHSEGYFRYGKYDELRDHFHDMIDRIFAKYAKHQNAAQKSNAYKHILLLIFNIAIDNKIVDEKNVEEQGKINSSKLFYFDLIFKHFNSMENENK